MLDLEKIKNSLSYQQAILKFKEKYEKEDLFNSRWAERIATAISLKTDEELGALYDSYLKHSKKRAGILNSQNIDGETSLNCHILNAFEKVGKLTEDEKYYGMFTAVVYLFRGFSAELVVGQGSYISINKL